MLCLPYDLPGDAEIAQKAHHIMVVLDRWRRDAEDPVEQVRVGAIEQGLEAIELNTVELRKGRLGKRTENQVAFLCPAIPAAKQQPSAADIRVILLSPKPTLLSVLRVVLRKAM